MNLISCPTDYKFDFLIYNIYVYIYIYIYIIKTY